MALLQEAGFGFEALVVPPPTPPNEFQRTLLALTRIERDRRVNIEWFKVRTPEAVAKVHKQQLLLCEAFEQFVKFSNCSACPQLRDFTTDQLVIRDISQGLGVLGIDLYRAQYHAKYCIMNQIHRYEQIAASCEPQGTTGLNEMNALVRTGIVSRVGYYGISISSGPGPLHK